MAISRTSWLARIAVAIERHQLPAFLDREAQAPRPAQEGEAMDVVRNA
jgi:hypothetical protein